MEAIGLAGYYNFELNRLNFGVCGADVVSNSPFDFLMVSVMDHHDHPSTQYFFVHLE